MPLFEQGLGLAVMVIARADVPLVPVKAPGLRAWSFLLWGSRNGRCRRRLPDEAEINMRKAYLTLSDSKRDTVLYLAFLGAALGVMLLIGAWDSMSVGRWAA